MLRAIRTDKWMKNKLSRRLIEDSYKRFSDFTSIPIDTNQYKEEISNQHAQSGLNLPHGSVKSTSSGFVDDILSMLTHHH